MKIVSEVFKGKKKNIFYSLVFIFVSFGFVVAQEQPQQEPAAAPAAAPEAAAPANENQPADVEVANNEQPKAAQNNEERLRVVFLEDFENAEDWSIKTTSPLGNPKLIKMPQVGQVKDSIDPNVTTVDGGDQVGKNHILGVKGYFYDKGFDRIEVFPPNEYAIKGIVKQISVWVLGRKYNHTLYVKLKDYRGKIHKVKLGKINFFGWRKMTANIPGFVPQSFKYSLLNENLRFVSLFIVSDVKEPVGSVYFYFDNLQVKTDIDSFEYPGSKVEDNW